MSPIKHHAPLSYEPYYAEGTFIVRM